MKFSLSQVLKSLTLAVAIAALPGQVAAQQATIKYLHIPGSTTYLPPYVGIEQGYFAAENIKLELIAGNSAAAIHTALATGDADTTQHALSFWATLATQGIDVSAVGVYWYVGRYLVLPKKDTTTPRIGKGNAAWRDVMQAMKGKTFGTIGGGLRSDTIGLFRLAGINAEKEVSLVDLNTAAAQVAAMDQGQIDGVIGTAAFAFTLVSAGKSELGVDLVTQGPAEHKGAMLTMTGIRKAALAQAPDLADRYARALARSVAYIKDPANTQALMTLAAKYGVKVDPTIMPELMKLVQRDIGNTMPRKDAELAMKWALDNGQIKKAVPIESIVLRGLVN